MVTKAVRKPDPVPKQTIDFGEERLNALKEVVPDAFSEGKLDVERLKTLLGTTVQEGTERYFFTWAGKKEAVLALQKPSSATLVPVGKESVDFDKTKNIFIEGENLEVLKLLYKSYFGRVKLIYIDPPYNTGNDFVYPDTFAEPMETYLQITGQKDSEGNLVTSNPETGGRYHSAWLSMMYPRLFLARQLLCESGVIFISIDDTEAAHLRLLMNEIFGEENFISALIWQKKVTPANDSKYFSNDHEYILVYAKSKKEGVIQRLGRTEAQNAYYKNPDNDPRGPWNSSAATCNKSKEERPNLYYPIINPHTKKEILPKQTAVWANSKKEFERLIKENRVWWGKKGTSESPRIKFFLTEAGNVVPRSILPYTEVGHTQSATLELRAMFPEGVFDYPKPSSLIKRLLQYTTTPEGNHLVLDFFAGSCTAAQAVLQQNREDGGNRRFIMVQLPEPLEEPKKLKEGTILNNIADIGRERIRRAIKEMKGERQAKLGKEQHVEDLGFRAFKLVPSNYGVWLPKQQTTIREYTEKMAKAIDSLRPGWKAEDVIYEIALKEGYSLDISMEMVDLKSAKVFKVIDPDKQQHFYVTLDEKVHLSGLKPLNLSKDDLFICRDIALDDTTAANLALQCRLKTV